jgi:hypothetical protein
MEAGDRVTIGMGGGCKTGFPTKPRTIPWGICDLRWGLSGSQKPNSRRKISSPATFGGEILEDQTLIEENQRTA